VDDVGGVLAKAPHEAQLELFDLLIDGCQEAVKENTDIKVITVYPFRKLYMALCTSPLLSSICTSNIGHSFGFFRCSCEALRIAGSC